MSHLGKKKMKKKSKVNLILLFPNATKMQLDLTCMNLQSDYIWIEFIAVSQTQRIIYHNCSGIIGQPVH